MRGSVARSRSCESLIRSCRLGGDGPEEFFDHTTPSAPIRGGCGLLLDVDGHPSSCRGGEFVKDLHVAPC